MVDNVVVRMTVATYLYDQKSTHSLAVTGKSAWEMLGRPSRELITARTTMRTPEPGAGAQLFCHEVGWQVGQARTLQDGGSA